MIFAPGTKTADTRNEKLIPVFSLGLQPLANDFVFSDPEGEHQGYAPLDVLMCPRCGLAQLSVVVSPGILYGGNYPYVTSKSNMMKEHFERIFKDLWERAAYPSVLEIGSNDGDLLAFFQEKGAESVLGIEPAINLSSAARARALDTICDFFNPQSAEIARQRMPQVGIIIARHVFCHVDDWQGFMKTLSLLADSDTVIFLEVPYVMDQLASNSFDQIYHEHLSYLSIRAFQALLNCGPFELQAVYHYPIHGGAIGLVIQRRQPDRKPEPSVHAYLEGEAALTPDAWKAFGQRSGEIISELRMYVNQLVEDGKRVVGFGASAKSSVWINACGFTRKQIGTVYDCTPEKLYRLIPGTDIPIMHHGGIFLDAPDYAVMFAWNFAGEILAGDLNRKWMLRGGKFIVPIPKLRVIGIDSDTGRG